MTATKYKKIYCKRIKEYAEEGKLPAYWAKQLKVAKSTIHHWRSLHEEFDDAYQEARDLAETWWLDQAQSTAKGEAGNPVLIKYMLSAAFGMSEKQEIVETPADENTETSIQVVFGKKNAKKDT